MGKCYYFAFIVVTLCVIHKNDATRCQPLSSFKIDCNECLCSSDGVTYVCTQKKCFGPPSKYFDDDDYTLPNPNKRTKRDSDEDMLLIDDDEYNNNQRIARKTDEIQPILVMDDDEEEAEQDRIARSNDDVVLIQDNLDDDEDSENNRVERDSDDMLLIEDDGDDFSENRRIARGANDKTKEVLMVDEDGEAVILPVVID